jgi:hypothetical protein
MVEGMLEWVVGSFRTCVLSRLSFVENSLTFSTDSTPCQTTRIPLPFRNPPTFPLPPLLFTNTPHPLNTPPSIPPPPSPSPTPHSCPPSLLPPSTPFLELLTTPHLCINTSPVLLSLSSILISVRR